MDFETIRLTKLKERGSPVMAAIWEAAAKAMLIGILLLSIPVALLCCPAFILLAYNKRKEQIALPLVDRILATRGVTICWREPREGVSRALLSHGYEITQTATPEICIALARREVLSGRQVASEDSLDLLTDKKLLAAFLASKWAWAVKGGERFN